MEAGFGFGNYWVVGGLLAAVSPFDGYFFISIFFFYGDGGYDIICPTRRYASYIKFIYTWVNCVGSIFIEPVTVSIVHRCILMIIRAGNTKSFYFHF